MQTEIKYEWAIETIDEFGDIIDSDFSDTLDRIANEPGNLVLVRNEGNENAGITGRYWAYIKNGKLPEYFSDSQAEVNIKVPQKFHKELANLIVTIK